MIRAFNPFPSAQTTLAGTPVKIWRATPCDGAGQAGEILATGKDGIVVACGEGALCLCELQKAGGKRLEAAAFLAGNPLHTQDYFGR